MRQELVEGRRQPVLNSVQLCLKWYHYSCWVLPVVRIGTFIVLDLWIIGWVCAQWTVPMVDKIASSLHI